MKYEVYHLDWTRARALEPRLFADATLGARGNAIRALRQQGLYAQVASVEVGAADEEDALEDVYRLTNSIDRHWTQNPEVRVTGNRQLRSTSVGDLVCIEDRCYLVAGVGFTRL